MIMIAIYVDDCLSIGTEKAIEEAGFELKGYDFGLKVKDNLTDCLSCKIVEKETKESFGSCNHISLTI
jgi:hypothetical protein